MLIRQGIHRTIDLNRRLAISLAGIAGALNTVAFKAVGFFAANMTGNASMLAGHVARGDWIDATTFSAIIAMFVLGATFTSILVGAGVRRRLRSVYAIGVLVESLLLCCLAIIEQYFTTLPRDLILILTLSFILGLQNALTTTISGAQIRTTHVSGLATDVGIEFGQWLELNRQGADDSKRAEIVSRIKLHGGTVLAFTSGGVAGLWLYQLAGIGVLLFIAVILLLMASWTFVRLAREADERS